MQAPILFYFQDTGTFPNSYLPAVLYQQAIQLPILFKALSIKRCFAKNNWTNLWDGGVFTYHHYHSTSHEVLGFYKGSTTLQLGGESGQAISIQAGDVLVIPAGVAHKNLGGEHQIGCIGAYPDGRDFDINTGKSGERPQTDLHIASLPIPNQDPIFGQDQGIPTIWTSPHPDSSHRF